LTLPHVTRDEGVKVYGRKLLFAADQRISRGPGLQPCHIRREVRCVSERRGKPPLLPIMAALARRSEWWRRLIDPLVALPADRLPRQSRRGPGDVPRAALDSGDGRQDAAAVMDAAGMASARVFGASMEQDDRGAGLEPSLARAR
jgi:hypothetical protein